MPKSGEPCYKANIKNEAVKKHFYSFTDEDGSLNTRIESGLSELEGLGSTILRKIIDKEILSDSERFLWALFLGILITRNPLARSGFDKLIEVMGERAKKYSISKMLQENSEIKKMAEELGNKDIGNADVVEMLQESLVVEVNPEASLEIINFGYYIAEYLVRMRWTIIEFVGSKRYFVTSDNPCYVVNKEAEKTGYGEGIALPGSTLFFPISPRLCFKAEWYEGEQLRFVRKLDRKEVDGINIRTMQYAYQKVFTARIDNRLRKQFENNRRYGLELQVDEIGPHIMQRKRLVSRRE